MEDILEPESASFSEQQSLGADVSNTDASISLFGSAATEDGKSFVGLDGEEKLRRAIAAVGEERVKKDGFLMPSRCLDLLPTDGLCAKFSVLGGERALCEADGSSFRANLSGLLKWERKPLLRLFESPGDGNDCLVDDDEDNGDVTAAENDDDDAEERADDM